MDLSEIAQSFLASSYGHQAITALGQQGIPASDATTMLSHAAVAAGEHANNHAASSGLLGDHPGRSFFAAFAAGLVKGDGLIGALEGGGAGIVTAKISEALCTKVGLDAGLASTVAATATPFLLDFLRKHIGG